ncbi:hypothetical protein EG68_09990 [Paragonimus skrjabini miyazakii]|uniref:IQ motif and ankyrin repeat domain-containing protein n=1 Tax=Paragonimus skrjabini miyazakii TaxID=59628 RepID=A0A8S9YSZ2_9TREM|nr:hypothetical protein EG68_09990 [Paragonimus skrjabini miyazakii]
MGDGNVGESCDPTYYKAAIIIQKYFRRYLARKQLEQRNKKKAYEAQIEELSKQAYLKMVEKYRREQEEKRQKEEQEKERIRIANYRKKCMLEYAFEGSVTEMKMLLQQVMDEDLQSGLGDDDIERAIKVRHIQELIECADANGNSALSEACIGGCIQAVQFLIDQGANVNAKGQYGRTPLYRAVFGRHLEVVQVLLQHGADPRIYAEDGQRPIDIASEGALYDLLSSWDTAETVRLLRQINSHRKKLEDLLSRGAEALVNSLKTRVEQRKKVYKMAQNKVCHAHEELNRRIYEYDSAKATGYENLSLPEQLICDAELHLETAKVNLETALGELQQAKLELREEERKDKRKVNEDNRPGIVCSLRDLDDVLFKDVGSHLAMAGKWPLVVDPTDRASTFLRYRDTNYVNVLNPHHLDPETIRIALLGALRYGKPFVLDLMGLDSIFESLCRPRFEAIKSTLICDIVEQRIRDPFTYEDLIKPTDSEEFAKSRFIQRNLDKFLFILVTKNPFPEESLTDQFLPVWIE